MHRCHYRAVQAFLMSDIDTVAMHAAIQQAALAYKAGEVPVGAVITDAHGQLVATGFNRVITDHDPTAHAEIVALRLAAQAMGNYRLPGLSLYVTLEPCVMCMGAMMHARISRVVYGAPDPNTGACASVLSLHAIRQLNHQTAVSGGIMEQECGEMLRRFFRERRVKKR